MKLDYPVGKDGENGFLPDLCNAESTLTLILFAALVAIVLTFARRGLDGFWSDFGRLALLAEFLTLASAASLCLLRRTLTRWNDFIAALATVVVLLGVAAAVAIGAQELESLFRDMPLDKLSPLGAVGTIVAITAVFDVMVLRYFYVRAKWRENVQREAHSRLEALQARLEPHFLFNSLNTALALIRDSPQEAEDTLQNLAELFRWSFTSHHSKVPLRQELELARRYLYIEALRLGERLRVNWNLSEEALCAEIPPLILQPLIENAVVHGIEPSAQPGLIEIDAHVRGKRVELEITSPLSPNGSARGHGVGLEGISARLKLMWSDAATLAVERRKGRFNVIISLPYERSSADANSHSRR